MLSEDGDWTWDGYRWTINVGVVTGDFIGRALVLTLLGAVPIGGLLSVLIWQTISPLNGLLGISGVIATLIVVKAAVLYLVNWDTPRVSIENGQLRIGRVGQPDRAREILVAEVTSIEMTRGSLTKLMLTEGGMGGGGVLVNLAHGKPIELQWDSFSHKASTLAWMLGVPLVTSAQ